MTNESTRVLVVEDERDLADLYTAWLERSYEVVTAYGGEDAIDLVDESVDVALLDRRMPGLSGDDVLSAIRERGYGCRIAMVTAVEPDFDIIDMGFDDYLVKPIGREELEETVGRLVTRTTYDRRLDEYTTLVSKKTALEAEKTRADLEGSTEFEELIERIEEVREEVDPMAEGFEHDDIAAVLRDIPAQSRT